MKRSTPHLTVDVILEQDHRFLVVERRFAPFGYALPGGFVEIGESVESAAAREVLEETGLQITQLQQFRVYSDPNRDPRHHTVSVVMSATFEGNPTPGDDAKGIKWLPFDTPGPLCFDHNQIITDFRHNTDWLLLKALEEDIGSGDLTGDAIFQDNDTIQKAQIIAKEPFVVSGTSACNAIWRNLGVRYNCRVTDGDSVTNQEILYTIEGPTTAILKGERVALNFLAHLCGVATATAQVVTALNNKRITILDTRKTTPLLRRYEKEAVRHGGGANHRSGLFDAIMIKDNHIDMCGDIRTALQRAKRSRPEGVPITIETRTVQEVEAAILEGVDRIMLDNMPINEMKKACHLIRQAGATEIEISGGITIDSIAQYRDLDVDAISIGWITHSARSVDISLLVDPPPRS